MPIKINPNNYRLAHASRSAGITARLSPKRASIGGGASSAGGMSGYGSSGQSSGYGSPGGQFRKGVYNPVYDNLDEGTVIEYWLPRDPARINSIFRRIFMLDPVAGPALELYKDLPFSDFQFTSVKDKHVLNLYADSFNAMNIVGILPDMALEYLKLGKLIGHMHMDESKGYFNHIEIHDPDQIRMTPSPLIGFPPKLDLAPSPQLREWANSDDPRDVDAQAAVSYYVSLIREGKDIPLDSSNSFYIPRRTAPYDQVGASIYTRILLFVAYEKAIVNASVTAARRRMGAIRHVTAGTEAWTPDEDEIQSVADLFTNADEDPVGAIVVTRDGVSVAEVGGDRLGDMTKISDEWDFLTKGKLNSLGISEAFLSGEATYNTIEQLMSVFLDRVRAIRSMFTNEVLIKEILRPLAEKNDFRRTTQARLSHRIRVAESYDNNDYILPDIVWEKNLRPVADRDWMDILEQMQSIGIPITIRTMTAAAGFDLDSEISQFEEDIEVRRQLSQQTDTIDGISSGLESGGDTEFGSESDAESMDDGGGSDDFGDFGADDSAPDETPDEGGGESFTLPSTESSSSKYPVPVIDNLYALPHFKGSKTFMGVRFDDIELSAHRILKFLDGKKQKLSSADFIRRKFIRFGTERKTMVAEYILSRCGLLLGTSYDKNFSNELMESLLKTIKDPKVLAPELAYLSSRTKFKDSKQVKSGIAQPDSIPKDLMRGMKLMSERSLHDKNLLTGVLPKGNI